MADEIPLTRNAVPEARAEAIRAAVRAISALPGDTAPASPARPEDAPALLAFFSDPAVSAPIYSIPRPLTLENVAAYIRGHQAGQADGVSALLLRKDEAGEVIGYSEFHFWPQWAAGELGGALHPRLQSQGAGGRGALATFDWMFEALDLDLICETSALDNVRTAKLLERIGFQKKGELLSTRPDGTTRPSIVWELTREDWRARES
ncbi:MAG: GNAT family N-acetyltransferase [Hyphomonadaceae bacterium]|nr:GNAT family N-acetyltransferase [Hyphomonadaceae bacterium]